MNPQHRATIFDTSEAWKRLQEPIDKTLSDAEKLQRVKHDVTTVFQNILGAISQMEPTIIDLQESHEALMERLFNVDKGTVVRLKGYVDEKVSKLYVRAVGLLTAVSTACVLLVVDIVRGR